MSEPRYYVSVCSGYRTMTHGGPLRPGVEAAVLDRVAGHARVDFWHSENEGNLRYELAGASVIERAAAAAAELNRLDAA